MSISTSCPLAACAAPPAPAIVPSTAYAFNAFLVNAVFKRFIIPCLATSLAVNPATPPAPAVKAPAKIDTKLVGSVTPAIL